MQPKVDISNIYKPAGLKRCPSRFGQADAFVNKLQLDKCIHCSNIYENARYKERNYIKSVRFNNYDPYEALEGSAKKYEFDYYIAMHLCPLSDYNMNDYVQKDDIYDQVYMIIILAIVVLMLILCCAWYFCFGANEVGEYQVNDRDIRERQLYGSTIDAKNKREFDAIKESPRKEESQQPPISQRNLISSR